MFEKSFITDCEGPLTLNDNAFELCAYFIENGGELFKILSLYDDYLVDEVKKDNYKAGNTLKLILPFFVVENLKNEDLINFSQEHIYVVNDSKFLLKYLQNAMNTYIVSTSYGQYIEAVSNFMEFPFKNTYYTNVDMDELNLNDGEILIDGVSTKDLTRKNIHSLFTMVLQDTWIFDGTVKENIVYNQRDASDYDVREVCKTVGLDHFIKTLPSGYDTVISEDLISAGQRQLLTIARGMMQNVPFLILDEATSNVDTRTEELVQKAMDKLTEGKTSFIIAHRLSTIKNADLILVMKDGNIIEQGDHESLLAKKGFYADLYNSQFEL